MNRRLSQNARISRRSLIGTGAAAALVAASTLTARAEPQRGGLLRLAAPGPVDPASRAPGLYGRLLAPGSVFDCLTEVGPDGRLMGELATDWTPRGGADAWVITLRRGVAFHDGHPFGADDAIASLKRHGDRLEIAGLRKLGPHQIQITLNAPDPGFPFALSDPSVVMLPAERAEAALREGNGTGLYRIAQDNSGGRVRLARVDDHWKDGAGGWFDTVELLQIDDPRARLETLLAGRADAAGEIDPMDLGEATSRTRVQTMTLRSNRRIQISAQGTGARTLADALKAGLDRQRILERVLGGYGRVGSDTPVPLGRPPEHDPDRGRAILAAQNIDRATLALGDGMTGFPGLSRLVAELQGSAERIGLSLSAAKHSADLVLDLAPAAPTEDLAIRRFPKSGLSDPERFDRLIREARIVSNTTLRRDLHGRIARELADQALTVVPVFADVAFAHTNRLTHHRHIGALDTLDSARMVERWFYGTLG